MSTSLTVVLKTKSYSATAKRLVLEVQLSRVDWTSSELLRGSTILVTECSMYLEQ